MKALLTILFILMIIGCFTEARIQVKPILLTVKTTEAAYREDRGQFYHVVWIDDKNTEYDMYCPCPQYITGYQQTFLITR